MNGVIPGVLMLAAFALTLGGVYLICTKQDSKRGILMLVAAAVFIANVLIMEL